MAKEQNLSPSAQATWEEIPVKAREQIVDFFRPVDIPEALRTLRRLRAVAAFHVDPELFTRELQEGLSHLNCLIEIYEEILEEQ